ncbi:MAG: Ig-like domain-containing protein [Candidatus Thiodiazotropha sp.]
MARAREWLIHWLVVFFIATYLAACDTSDSDTDSDSTTELTGTTTSLSTSSTSLEIGEALTLIATVSPSEASGTVAFLDGTSSLGTATLGSGTATLTISTLAAGTHNLSVSYAGDGDYDTSTSETAVVTITTSASASASWSSGVCGYGTAVYLLDSGTLSESNVTYEASSTDESAICITGSSSTLILNNPVINTVGDSSSDENSSFYGLNAAVLNYNGGDLTISGGSIDTSGTGANAVFAYGTGSTTVSNMTIVATNDFAHGLFAAGGGTMIVNNVDATTSGISSSVVGTDRGSGTIDVYGGSYTASGMRSAGIYSTGVITATDATFTATNAEAVVVEGSNIAILENVTLNATSDLTEHRGVFLYQSMSGDADNSECGTGACFTMTGGIYNYTDTTNSSSTATDNCAAFAVANQTAYIELTDVEVNNSCPTLLLSALNSNWNYNGGTTTFIANGENLEGNVIVDSVSTTDITLSSSDNGASTLTGAINTDNTGSSVSLTLDAASQWVVTGTSYLTSLTNSDSSNSNIICETMGCQVYVNGSAIDID